MVLERHARIMLSLPGVVGIAEGDADGKPCIKIYVAKKTAQVVDQIPLDLDGWPVVVEESGEFRALSG